MIELPYLHRRGGPFPVIPLVLRHQEKEVVTEALIDSGASLSLFHASFAEYLGIELRKGTQLYLEGIGGRVLGWMHELEMEAEGIRLSQRIVFSAELITSFNLLGRNNFFEAFDITFCEQEKRIHIKPGGKGERAT